VKSYLVTTGALYGLLAVWHLYLLLTEWHLPGHDRGFVLGMGAIVVAAGVLSGWAFTLLKRSGGGDA